MRDYKTPEALRLRAKERRDAIKLAGGPEYEALLERERRARAEFRARHPDKAKASRQRNRRKPWRTHVVAKARARARKRGLEATLAVDDVVWPDRCPVLGIPLFYPERSGEKTDPNRPDLPTLDRFDNSMGYVAGNVFVISMRANALKNNASADELEAVARYARLGAAAFNP